VNLWFVDDSRQRTPSRGGMGPLVSVGGLCVSEAQVKTLEAELQCLCADTGLGQEEFKWSPGRELWMYANLKGQQRTAFFIAALQIALSRGVVGIHVSADTNMRSATGNAPDSETDVTRMLLERIHNCTPEGELALVVADHPGGAKQAADEFVERCLATIRTGTNVLTDLERVCLVLTCDSRLVRCLQLADVFASCLTAYIGGERVYSPPVVEAILPILRRSFRGNLGGVGIKIHPDLRYANLYHWLFNDTIIVKANCGTGLPYRRWPYPQSPDLP